MEGQINGVRPSCEGHSDHVKKFSSHFIFQAQISLMPSLILSRHRARLEFASNELFPDSKLNKTGHLKTSWNYQSDGSRKAYKRVQYECFKKPLSR